MDLKKFYRTALTIRCFEEKVDWLFSRALLGGTTHLCIGQEAVAVGVAQALRFDDYMVSTHRGHGHLIAKGGSLVKMFAELLGKKEGYCKGRGGTQHICAADINFLGTNGITGGGIPTATGAGLSIKLSKEDRIAVCFFGEGASNQGTFHESLNMASVWNLPVLYVCEHNMYAMSTRFTKVSKFDDVSARAAAYGIPSMIVDGMDALKIYEGAGELINGIRSGKGPALLEAKTYRFCGHSKSDPRTYRTRAEESQWKERDPISLLEAGLLKSVGNSVIEGIKKIVMAEVEDAYLEASSMEDTAVEDAVSGVYGEREDIIQEGRIQGDRAVSVTR